MSKMSEKLPVISPWRSLLRSAIFNKCLAQDTMSNMAAVEHLEVQDQKPLEALFKEDSM
jgi:hypothetical protein